ncbi:hypothetical protein MHYP_G00312890 [Metynnis hypsauchen]
MGFQAEILSRDIRKVIREGSVQLQSREQNFKAERFEQLERKVWRGRSQWQGPQNSFHFLSVSLACSVCMRSRDNSLALPAPQHLWLYF